ncbi:hypothetical protein Moror_15720, partial [Moniliophthora roreri MCA 2997]
ALICALNIQHNCSSAQCKDSTTQNIMQEQKETAHTQSIISHNPVNCYILNTHSLHNYSSISMAIPQTLKDKLKHKAQSASKAADFRLKTAHKVWTQKQEAKEEKEHKEAEREQKKVDQEQKKTEKEKAKHDREAATSGDRLHDNAGNSLQLQPAWQKHKVVMQGPSNTPPNQLVPLQDNPAEPVGEQATAASTSQQPQSQLVTNA